MEKDGTKEALKLAERIRDAMKRYPPKEQERIRSAILDLKGKNPIKTWDAIKVAAECVCAGSRTIAKKDSDKATDGMRRVLVGARVKREFGEKCKHAAKARGLSLYAWVCEALERALEAQWMD